MQPGSWNLLSLCKDSSMVLLVQLPTESQKRTNSLAIARGCHLLLRTPPPHTHTLVPVMLKPATSPPFLHFLSDLLPCFASSNWEQMPGCLNEHICDDWCESVEALSLICPG
ncbi:hypothetical protein XENORESO_007514 [Xenotaenia resolanae]|uniref:Uncharacterized protein n=1 Tax=Xenotaenia resolanae TaxID=208358 RepID=A0ABV0W7L9_9TELE